VTGRVNDGIEDPLDAAVGDREREALQLDCASRREGREREPRAEHARFIAQDRKRQAKPRDKFALIGRILAAQAEEPLTPWAKSP
jgi:hypothetical protein